MLKRSRVIDFEKEYPELCTDAVQERRKKLQMTCQSNIAGTVEMVGLVDTVEVVGVEVETPMPTPTCTFHDAPGGWSTPTSQNAPDSWTLGTTL